jgi:formyl-CoA transferase
LKKAGVSCGPINGMAEMFADPQVQHLGVTANFPTRYFGPKRMLAQSFMLSRTPSALKVAPPEKGQATDEILSNLCYGTNEIADLGTRNVV